jgi:tetratricopeptide (TPR) repeat protein
VALVAGAELRAHGHVEASLDVYRQAVDWLREDLLRDGESFSTRLRLARALYGAESWAEAQEEAEALLAQEPEGLAVLGLLGCASARAGDTTRAREAMNRLSGLDRPDQPAENLYQMATIAAVLGRNDEAMRLLYRAYDEGVPHGLRLHQDMSFESLREREDFIALVTPKG